jgi:DNA-binding HxlR family transcriptional regulator
MECPVARSLEEVGEWWSILILRDAFRGLTRFDELSKSLGVAPSILTRRLAALIEHGLLEKRRYSERPPRDEYVLTDKGRDFLPVLLSLVAWGNRHLAGPEGPAVLVTDRETGALVDPAVVDRHTSKILSSHNVRLVAGPGAGSWVLARLTGAGARRVELSTDAEGASKT